MFRMALVIVIELAVTKTKGPLVHGVFEYIPEPGTV